MVCVRGTGDWTGGWEGLNTTPGIVLWWSFVFILPSDLAWGSIY